MLLHFKKKSHLYLLIASNYFSISICGITVNGQDLTQLAKPGQVVCFSMEEAENLAVQFIGNELRLGRMAGRDLLKAKEDYQIQKAKLVQPTFSCDGTCPLYVGSMEGGYVESPDELIIYPYERSLHIAKAILLAPLVSLSGHTITLESCFLEKCDAVEINIVSPTSPIKLVIIEFADDAEFRLIEGAISEDGRMHEPVIAVGAKTLKILFNESAYETN